MIELKILVDEIDYSSLADLLVPLLAAGMKDGKGGILGDVLAKNPDTATAMVRTILSKMSQEKKDELLLQMLEKYHDKILGAAQSALTGHDIAVKIYDFTAGKK